MGHATNEIVTRTVAAGDVDLVVDEAGAGGRPFLLVHGFTGSRTDFDMALGPLAAAGWHAVAPDLRGHGGSSQPPEEADYTLEAFAGDVLGLADALGFDRFVLLGHSMGGMIAEVAALQAPERLDGLVLMDTSHGPLAALAEQAELVQAVVALARRDGMGAVADAMADQAFLESGAYRRAVERDPAYGLRGDTNRRAASAAMFAAMAQAIGSQPDRLEALRSVEVPTLVLVGEEDEPFLEDSRRMAEAIPGARLAVVAGGGHSPQFEAHDGWWAALTGFLGSLR